MHIFTAAPKGEFNAWSVIASGTLDVENFNLKLKEIPNCVNKRKYI